MLIAVSKGALPHRFAAPAAVPCEQEALEGRDAPCASGDLLGFGGSGWALARGMSALRACCHSGKT